MMRRICKSFDIEGDFLTSTELTTGNINSTFRVTYLKDGERRDYIIQQINTAVFVNPEKVMENIVNVTHYVRNNIKKQHLPTRKFVLRVFLEKQTKKPYIVDDTGRYWRAYRYIENSVTYDTTDDMDIICRAGEAFGRFQNCLDGYNANDLFVTIPDFHNTIKRYSDFKVAVENDLAGRVQYLNSEIEDILSFEQKAIKIQTMLKNKELPLRVTHNDTKCNNVAFDRNTGEALAVLDLDTVMPGAIAHDFGDAIRFIANNELEDSPEYDLVSINLDKYRAFTKGFIGEVKESITLREAELLPYSAYLMTIECGMRFLADYLEGDVYFGIKYPEHNLVRARTQIKLAGEMQAQEEKMKEIVFAILNK